VAGAGLFGEVSEGQITLRGDGTQMKIAITHPLITGGRMEMREEGMNGKKENMMLGLARLRMYRRLRKERS
jgi:hypothetical protein